jgi:hypothetical protein
MLYKLVLFVSDFVLNLILKIRFNWLVQQKIQRSWKPTNGWAPNSKMRSSYQYQKRSSQRTVSQSIFLAESLQTKVLPTPVGHNNTLFFEMFFFYSPITIHPRGSVTPRTSLRVYHDYVNRRPIVILHFPPKLTGRYQTFFKTPHLSIMKRKYSELAAVSVSYVDIMSRNWLLCPEDFVNVA